MRKFKGAGWKPAALSRSNTTSSIRGRISAPIPLAVDDDEFPIREPGTGIATPLGHEGLEKQPRLPSPLQVDNAKHEEADIPDLVEEPARTATAAPPSTTPSPGSTIRQATRNSPLRDSGARDSEASNPSLEKPQRKKSTLGSVLRRLFGKKRKSNGSANGQHEESARAGQHRSDPTALRKLGDQALSPQRSASMPINDYNRALSSHLPFAEDRPTQNLGGIRDLKEVDGRTRPRRATTPSRLYEPTRTPGYVDWTGLSPRPASSHARASGVFAGDGYQSPIGFAVTSGSHPNRRSRSLGHLREVAAQNRVRRRSDEIRYLRESYDLDVLSPMSSHYKPEAELLQASQENEDSREAEIQEAPQPFNFGPLGDMAGMKITEAASLETRVSTLEAKLQEAENAIVCLHNRRSESVLQDSPQSQYTHSSYVTRPRTDNSDKSFPRHPPSRMYQQTSNPQADSLHSSRPSTTSTQNSRPQKSYEELSPRRAYLSPEQTPQPRLSHSNVAALQSDLTGRPLSTSTTIRAITSSSPLYTPNRELPLSKHGSLTAHHYSALLNLITAEQAARQQLEVQVMTLQRQIQTLLSNSGSGGGSDMAHPSPRGNHMGHAKTNEFSSFEHDESWSESESEVYRDDAETEVYQTPREERGHYAIGSPDGYGDENEEVEGQGEPRTLSLSQLTMGKSVLASAGF